MAFIRDEFCRTCDRETSHTNGRCGVCVQKAELKERQIYFDKLDHMTIEQRIRRIEQWIYNHNRESFPLFGS